MVIWTLVVKYSAKPLWKKTTPNLFRVPTPLLLLPLSNLLDTATHTYPSALQLCSLLIFTLEPSGYYCLIGCIWEVDMSILTTIHYSYLRPLDLIVARQSFGLERSTKYPSRYI